MITIPDYNVVLINTPYSSEYIRYSTNLTYQEHLGLAYLASFIKKSNFNVEIFDCNIQNYSLKDILALMKEKKPDFIGLTATSHSIKNAIRFSRKFKSYNSHLCIGGHHASFAAKEILNESNFDIVVYGEGEITIVELLKALNNDRKLDMVNGIYYKENAIKKNPPRDNINDLDSLPFPDRSIPEYCRDNDIQVIINIISSRGCPYNCSFCDIARFYRLGGKPWRARSAENFIDELEVITTRFPNFYIQFSDDNFVGYNRDKSRIYTIANEILNRGIQVKFDIRCRADSFIIDEDDNLLELLKESGLNSILLGIDGGCDSTLELFNKGITEKKNLNMINYLRSKDIVLQMGYIMFHPYLTIFSLKKQLDFFIKSKQTLYSQMTNRLEIYPGIDLIDDLERAGFLVDQDHKNIYPYKYMDENVKIVAENLTKIQAKMDKFDGLIQHLELIEPDMKNLSKINDLKDIIHKIYREKNEIVNVYYDLFNFSILLVKKGWKSKKFTEYTNSCIQILEEKYKSINNLINKVKIFFNKSRGIHLL
ncbi:MAG: radical SAM protein [Candidatus Lokiarchaeota archaeon]|nr:radical SAM protein [Candidatus Lokiarchaeota archaeon]